MQYAIRSVFRWLCSYRDIDDAVPNNSGLNRDTYSRMLPNEDFSNSQRPSLVERSVDVPLLDLVRPSDKIESSDNKSIEVIENPLELLTTAITKNKLQEFRELLNDKNVRVALAKLQYKETYVVVVKCLDNDKFNYLDSLLPNQHSDVFSIFILSTDNSSILHAAAKVGALRCLKVLISQLKKMNRTYILKDQDKYKRMPLHYAAEKGFDLCVSLLLTYHPQDNVKRNFRSEYDDNKDCDGNYALHLAAGNGHVDCVRLLLGVCESAFLTAFNYSSKSPLMLAVDKRHSKCIELLARKNPDVLLSEDYECSSPVYIAARNGDINSLVQMLKQKEGLMALEVRRHYDGFTPIMVSLTNGHLSCVHLMAKLSKKSLSIQGFYGLNLLHLAAENRNMLKELMDILIDNSPEDFVVSKYKGQTPLHLAVLKHNTECVRWIVNRRPNSMFILNYKSYSPVQLAAMRCVPRCAGKCAKIECLKLMIAKNPGCLEEPSIYNNTLLHFAALDGNIESLEVICEIKPACAYSFNKCGCTPVYLAIRRGHLDCVKRLMRLDSKPINPLTCIDIDVVDTDDVTINRHFYFARHRGSTTLHIAIEKGYFIWVKKIMIEFEQSLLIKDRYGDTPFQLAVKLDKKEMVNYIINHHIVRRKLTVVKSFLALSNRYKKQCLLDSKKTQMDYFKSWVLNHKSLYYVLIDPWIVNNTIKERSIIDTLDLRTTYTVPYSSYYERAIVLYNS